MSKSQNRGIVVIDGTWTYTWKNGRQLATMSKSGTTWNFFYDASGMRTQRTNGSTTYTYTYDGGKLTQMKMGSSTMRFTYGINGHPVSLNYDGTVYYYITNAQGDVVGILNSSGQEVVSYTYDAWGNTVKRSGSKADTLGLHNPLRYRGYVYDQETKLYYLQSRYYSPDICRFISADSISYLGADGTPVSYNLFAYCGNNPTMKVFYTILATSIVVHPNVNNLNHTTTNPNATNNFMDADGALELFSAFAGVLENAIWGSSQEGRAFLDFYYSAYGYNRAYVLDNVTSPLGRACKIIDIALILSDTIGAYNNKLQLGCSNEQALQSAFATGVKEVGVSVASYYAARSVGMLVASGKIGKTLGAFAGPIGIIAGGIVGYAVGWLLDEMIN